MMIERALRPTPGDGADEQPSHALALEAASVYTLQVDLDSGRIQASDAFNCLIGHPPGQVLEWTDFTACIREEDRERIQIEAVRSLPPGRLFEDQFTLVTAVGALRRLLGRGQIVHDARGRPSSMLGVLVDVTDRWEAQHAYEVMVAVTDDAFVGTGADGLVTEWNRASERVFGWSPSQAMGRPLAELIIPERHRRAHADAFDRLLAGSRELPFARGPVDITALRADGNEFPAEITFAGLEVQGKLAFRAFVRDITQRKRMEARLVERALNDELTALPNRALLGDRLDQALSRLSRSDSSLAVLFIDVDRFKVINDSLGHAAGDQLLQSIAVRLHMTVRPTDTVARFGGDEFVVICEGVDEAEALGLAQRLLDALAEPIEVRSRNLHVGVSIGIVMAQAPGLRPEDLLRDSDAAMYQAKERGGARAALFDTATRTRAVTRLDLEADLRRAIERDELSVAYQPVLNLDGKTVHVEALVRWNHPTRGVISPADFIPVAEETGLILALGAQVLVKACSQVAAWDAAGVGGLAVAVNLSGRQLAQPDLVDIVCDALGAAGIGPERLWLEITESVLMEDTSGSAKVLTQLAALGVGLAVDDFGTGYSSLQYLRRFPVKQLKLDRAFVSGVARNADDTTIVRAVIDLAHALGLEAVAEGVETTEQLEALRAMGCDFGQGYLWSRAVAPDAIADLVRVTLVG
jgi:diguanylate cyclase (GGDEF)-like protein/PAS domain S-box-containing protein